MFFFCRLATTPLHPFSREPAMQVITILSLYPHSNCECFDSYGDLLLHFHFHSKHIHIILFFCFVLFRMFMCVRVFIPKRLFITLYTIVQNKNKSQKKPPTNLKQAKIYRIYVAFIGQQQAILNVHTLIDNKRKIFGIFIQSLRLCIRIRQASKRMNIK